MIHYASKCVADLGASLPKLRSTRTAYQLTGLASDSQQLDALVARNAAYTLGYYRRLGCLLGSRFRHEMRRTIRPHHADRLIEACGEGRGAVLVAMHLGDFDLAVSWIAHAIGRSPVVPVAELQHPAAQMAFTAVRRACRFTLVPAADVSVPMLVRRLEAGHLVILTLDRRIKGRTIEVLHFGRRTTLPATCLTIAGQARVPILTAATWSRPEGRVLAFGEILSPAAERSLEADTALMQHLSNELQDAILDAPHQWHIPAQLDQLSIV
jgi:lauroyl/myristoyl acyltransferase